MTVVTVDPKIYLFKGFAALGAPDRGGNEDHSTSFRHSEEVYLQRLIVFRPLKTCTGLNKDGVRESFQSWETLCSCRNIITQRNVS